MNCKDDVLNAMLYSNRATAYFSLGKQNLIEFILYCRVWSTKLFQEFLNGKKTKAISPM